jgi:negative regulator of flagellin synthesis FlgM
MIMANRINPVDQGMVGRINGKTNEKTGEAGAARGIAADPSSVRKDTGHVGGGDTVELTSSARLLERVEKSLAGMPDLDSSRIEAVRSAIERGDYSIDAERIAEALLKSDQALGK